MESGEKAGPGHSGRKVASTKLQLELSVPEPDRHQCDLERSGIKGTGRKREAEAATSPAPPLDLTVCRLLYQPPIFTEVVCSSA